MNRAPAFQFYAADWLADERVLLMTLEEEGAYIHLLSLCWREGSIPSEEAKLSRICKGASTTVLSVVRECFEEALGDPSRLVHKRLEAERAKQAEWREKSSSGGKVSAAARAAKKSNTNKDAEIASSALGADPNSRVVEPPYQPNGNTASSSLSSSSKQRQQLLSPSAPQLVVSQPEKAAARKFTEQDALPIFRLWPNQAGKKQGIANIILALEERHASGVQDPIADLTKRVKTWLAWHARETAKGVFVPTIGYAEGWFGRNSGGISMMPRPRPPSRS